MDSQTFIIFFFRFYMKRYFLENSAALYNCFKFRTQLAEITREDCAANIIEIYKHGHKSLCKLIHFLNEMYKLHLLMTVASCFLMSIFNIYFALFNYGFYNWTRVSELQAKLLRFILSNFVFFVIRFLIVISVAQTTTHEVIFIIYYVKLRYET